MYLSFCCTLTDLQRLTKKNEKWTKMILRQLKKLTQQQLLNFEIELKTNWKL